MGMAENEDAPMDLLRPEHIKTLVLVKIKAFGAMIRETREKATELYGQRKKENPSAQEEQKSEPKEDQLMKEDGEKLPDIMVKIKAAAEKKADSAAADANLASPSQA